MVIWTSTLVLSRAQAGGESQGQQWSLLHASEKNHLNWPPCAGRKYSIFTLNSGHTFYDRALHSGRNNLIGPHITDKKISWLFQIREYIGNGSLHGCPVKVDFRNKSLHISEYSVSLTRVYSNTLTPRKCSDDCGIVLRSCQHIPRYLFTVISNMANFLLHKTVAFLTSTNQKLIKIIFCLSPHCIAISTCWVLH